MYQKLPTFCKFTRKNTLFLDDCATYVVTSGVYVTIRFCLLCELPILQGKNYKQVILRLAGVQSSVRGVTQKYAFIYSTENVFLWVYYVIVLSLQKFNSQKVDKPNILYLRSDKSWRTGGVFDSLSCNFIYLQRQTYLPINTPTNVDNYSLLNLNRMINTLGLLVFFFFLINTTLIIENM